MDPEALLDPARITTIFLIFVRIGSMTTAAPFFSHKSIPMMLRILIAIMLSWIVVGYVTPPPGNLIARPLGLVVAVGVEALTGIAIGFAAEFVFQGVKYAADILGFQMGLAMAQVFDPATGQSTNPIGQMMLMVFMLVFILMDGPHILIKTLVISFAAIPLAAADLQATGPQVLRWAGGLFVSGLRIASPFMITFFLVESAMGIFARVVPQADLFSLGLPIKLLIGLSLGILFVQNLVPLTPSLLGEMNTSLLDLIDAMRP
jgi:flagellar biosynthesis protein FliR